MEIIVIKDIILAKRFFSFVSETKTRTTSIKYFSYNVRCLFSPKKLNKIGVISAEKQNQVFVTKESLKQAMYP